MRAKSLLLAGVTVTTLAAGATPKQVGTTPVPVITDIRTISTASYDAASSVYRYEYTVTSGAGNKGNIWEVNFDDRAPEDYVAPRSAGTYTMLRGNKTVPFDQMRDEMSYLSGHAKGTLVELGIQGPAGWMGSVGASGDVGLFYTGHGGRILAPGTSLSFTLLSPNQPVIKDLQITPDWILSVDGEADEQEEADAAEVEQQLLILKPALVPGAEWPGSHEHWAHFRADVDKAAALGWITDVGLADTIRRQLDAARQSADAQGNPAAVPALRALLTTLEASTPAQRDDSAYALLKLNTEALIAHASDTAASKPTGQYTPRLSLTPEKQSPPLGTTVTVTAQMTDKGNGNAPVAGHAMELKVVGGIHAGQSVKGVTDASGRLSISLQSDKPGSDIIELREGTNLLFAQVKWGGGPDLIVGFVFPPLIRWDGHSKIRVQDLTENAGDAPAGSSVTRFYASTAMPVDPKTARAVGERQVSTLQVEQMDRNDGLDVLFPADLPPGLYHIIACADADDQVAEGNEGNNCVEQGMRGMAASHDPAHP